LGDSSLDCQTIHSTIQPEHEQGKEDRYSMHRVMKKSHTYIRKQDIKGEE